MGIVKGVARVLSRKLATRPHLLFAAQHFWLRLGYAVLDLNMAAWVIRRPEWLRQKPHGPSKMLEPEFSSSLSNIALASRIIAMARHSDSADHNVLIPDESIWGELRQSHYATLCALVETGDVVQLDDHLQKLFRTDAVNGYTYGSTFNSWPHRWNYLPVQIELSVVQLAESIGILRAECSEQGEIAFWRSILNEDELIDKLEAHFGFRVEQPRYGDPRGIMFGQRFLTRETCSHLSTAHRMAAAIRRSRLSPPYKIVEIGGGFGGTSYWLRKILGKDAMHYAIVDLPEVSIVQAAFLGNTDSENLILKGENNKKKEKSIELVPFNKIEEISFEPNILINQDSMPEMPESEVVRYINWSRENVSGLFISFNQETYSKSHNTLQNNVSEIATRFPHLQRISRDTSWDRRGYVEEVYYCNMTDS